MIDGLFVSPTEPALLLSLGTSSISMTERYGVDILWGTRHGLHGVQRKRLDDLVASMHDGRLRKEVAQMNGMLATRILLVEGRARWLADGRMDGIVSRVTREQLRKFLWSIRLDGIWVEYTDNLTDTVHTVQWLVEWSRKERHTSLVGRNGPKGEWGKAGDRAFQIHMLTSIDGIGVEMAERILEKFGRVPWSWDVTMDQLMEIDGIGKVRASKMLQALDGAAAV